MYLFVWLYRPKSKQFPEILALGDDAFRYSLKQHVKTQYEDDSNLTWFVLVSSSRTLNYWTSWLAMIPMKNVPRREGCLQWNAFFYYLNLLLNSRSFYQVCPETPFYKGLESEFSVIFGTVFGNTLLLIKQNFGHIWHRFLQYLAADKAKFRSYLTPFPAIPCCW